MGVRQPYRTVSVYAENLQILKIKIKVAGSRPRRRLPFCPGQQKGSKKWPFNGLGVSFVPWKIQGCAGRLSLGRVGHRNIYSRSMTATAHSVVECALTKSFASRTGGLKGCGIDRGAVLMEFRSVFAENPTSPMSYSLCQCHAPSPLMGEGRDGGETGTSHA